MRYEFHPEARVEYLKAVANYEERQAGLERFTVEIESAVQRHITNGSLASVVGFRSALSDESVPIRTHLCGVKE